MREEILSSLAQEFPDSQLDVLLEGNRVLITVVSERFRGLNRVRQQQLVYAALNEYLADGRLHAVTIRAQIPE
jgi:acid stress-induced BolA-like protein IbaG/YrbA